MEYTFNLAGETPAKKNSRITLRNGMTIPSKRYREWHRIALEELNAQRKPFEPLDCPVDICLKFVHGDLRRRDSDNGCSSIMDLLVDAGILLDDNWYIVRNISIHNEYVPKSAKCSICITCDEK